MDEGSMLVFGDTLHRHHDVIIFMGKDPSNDIESVKRVDQYGKNWSNSGRGTSCPRWDMAYSLSGKLTRYNTRQLKGMCATAGSSPIVFANLSPQFLEWRYNPIEKKHIRASIKAQTYRNHLENIFSHKALIERVTLIVCAGHQGSGLDSGIPILENMCKENAIDYCHAASLSSTRHTTAYRIEQLGTHTDRIIRAFDSLSHSSQSNLRTAA